MKKAVNIIFPHQLFAHSPLLANGYEVCLIEEYLFFRQYRFHKQKLAFHRASMRTYKASLEGKGLKVTYIESTNSLSDIRLLIEDLESRGFTAINIIDPVDNWLEKRIRKTAVKIELNVLESPLFLNTNKDNLSFFKPEKVFFFQTAFYKQQRKKLNILLNKDKTPVGGKWTYDTENRKKYPRGKTPPGIHFPKPSPIWEEAVSYVQDHFNENPGKLSSSLIYPISHAGAKEWFEQFLNFRFHDFGIYEDAIVMNELILNHSVLSPLLNVGLLLPENVLAQSLAFAESARIPLNATEGFIRQIIGWREFVRGIYICKGSRSRTRNFWKFDRKIPLSFYTGTTGIDPVDQTIKKVLDTGYCHHIERLMVLGNFMLLCEFDPDEVYKWFMELFIDAYDWVMVPNVYGMSQFADGGYFATKPYISGSNYLKKMSDFPGGEWQQVWDGLFWRFIHRHQDFFQKNPRTSMLYHSYHRMSPEKRAIHLENAEEFIAAMETQSGIANAKPGYPH
ncbi:cryptochrome/photolyase family protein [Fulvivirgaceae bacterium BMA12]|uniref:Cryptochrome/photolyase family protein n=1 Tax=Agaribacillus aureus TaxID=3051825 RepID=A0ABT8LHB5_9BACT|nr:cryptochrome/photolyase family protein [Fulvivirgaceae bacterium BMA12]